MTTFHSKLQQATRTRHQPSALCSRSLLPKGRSWNKHGIASLNYKCCRDISFSMVQIAPHLERKTKKTAFILQLPEGHQNMWTAYLLHTLDLLYLQERWRVNCLWKLMEPTYIFSMWKYGQNSQSLWGEWDGVRGFFVKQTWTDFLASLQFTATSSCW